MFFFKESNKKTYEEIGKMLSKEEKKEAKKKIEEIEAMAETMPECKEMYTEKVNREYDALNNFYDENIDNICNDLLKTKQN